MNLTDAIKEDNDKQNAERMRDYVRENPFSKEHWNITRQIGVKKDNPELAELLSTCRGVTLPTAILDELPKDLMSALKEYARHVTDANARIESAKDHKGGER